MREKPVTGGKRGGGNMEDQEDREISKMEKMEKVYKTMSTSGIMGIVAGCVIIAAGLATGIMMIISGAALLKHKDKITF